MANRTIALALGAWAALAGASRAEDDLPEALPAPQPAATAVAPPAGVAAPAWAGPDYAESCCQEAPPRHPCLRRLGQWLTYRPTRGRCDECGDCGGCKECTPCCRPALHAFFLHRCACQAYHYPEVPKTWKGHWPPPYVSEADTDVYYDPDVDTDRP